MPETNSSEVLHEIEALESELEAIRVAVDEGEETFSSAPTAREAALRHLELAMRHTLESARALIEATDWEQTDDGLEAIEILAEENVIPGRLGVSLIALAEYAAEHEDDQAWEAEESAEGAFEHVSMGAESLAEYLEYVHHYLKDLEA